jgi:hypothetical protein
MRFIKLISVLVVLVFSACGGIYKPGSVRGYDPKTASVLTYGGGAYRVGVLPSNWQRESIKWKAVLFRERATQATITVSSWCKSAFSDEPLKDLDRELYHGLSKVRVDDSQIVKLAHFDARRTTASGEFDGRKVWLRTYILKLNECVFDFVYVTKEGRWSGQKDFDAMVMGFDYLKGPDRL